MRKAGVLVAIVLVVFVAAGTAMAVMDIFLKIDGIPGESTNDKHKDEIEVLSWSWGMTNAATGAPGGGGGAGKVEFQGMAFTKYLDKATPKLFEAVASGEHLSKATLSFVQAGKAEFTFFKMILSDILVTSFSQGASAGGADLRPIEQISLSFGKVEMTYTTQNADGSPGGAVSAFWDIRANKGF